MMRLTSSSMLYFLLLYIICDNLYIVLISPSEGVRGVMETDCILHSTNTLGKGMNPIILPSAMGK